MAVAEQRTLELLVFGALTDLLPGVQQALRTEDGRRSLEGSELWREGGWGCVVGQGRWAGTGSRRALSAAQGSLHLLGTLQGRSLRGLRGHSGQKL